MSKTQIRLADFTNITEAARSRTTGSIDAWNQAFIDTDGSWILQSKGIGNDSGLPRPLLAVLPFEADGTRVHSLYAGTNPDLIDTLRDAIDGEPTR